VVEEPVVAEPVVGPTPLLVEDLRALRRWLAALTALSVLAAAIAVYALLKANDVDDRAASRAAVVRLDDRVDGVERRLRRTSARSDVTRLDQRLAAKSDVSEVRALRRRLDRVERSAAGAARGGRTATSDVDELNRRVDALARQLGDIERRSNAP
jgi:hypothetical protein